MLSLPGSFQKRFLLCLFFPLLVGCSGLAHFDDASTATSLLPAIAGTVHGGQQPVSGTTVQLYASNTTTLKGASTALIASSVLTDAGGNFSITGTYTCPAPGSLVYLVVTGGNPGLAAGTNNVSLSLMAVLGTCGTLTASTHVVINELTTVAAVEALMPFMADGSHVGANLAAAPDALSVPFAAAAAVVDPSSGQFAALAAGQATPPYALYNTLADILAACINSNGQTTTGGFIDTNKPCGALLFTAGGGNPPFGAGVTSPDTLVAMLRMAQFPGNSVPQLFNLKTASAPFQPTLATVPTDFTTAYTVQVPSQGLSSYYYPRLLAIDGQQHIWVAQYSQPYLYEYDQNMTLLRTITSDTYSIFFLEADPSGNIWAGGSNILSKYAPDGTVLIPGGVNIFALGFYMSNTGMTIDGQGNLWVSTQQSRSGVGPSGRSVPCFAKFSSSGAPLFPAPGACVSGTVAGPPLGIAVDAAGNGYISTDTPRALLKVNSAGVIQNGTGTTSSYRGAQMHYDPGTDRLLLLDQPYIAAYKTSDLSLVSGFVGSGHNLENTNHITLDGANNYWFGRTPDIGNSGTVISSLGELSNAFDFRLLASRHPIPGDIGLNDPEGIGIDAYGNVWLVNYGNRTLTKVPAVAAPKTLQIY